jgi:hypothetical protein
LVAFSIELKPLADYSAVFQSGAPPPATCHLPPASHLPATKLYFWTHNFRVLMSPTHYLLYVVVLYLFSSTEAYLQKRASSPLKTLHIPLRVDANRRYVVGVNMSSGLNQQSLGLAVATSTGYTTVAGVGCSSCSDVPKYNQSASSSAKPSTSGQAVASVQLFNGSASGSVVKEDCALHESNGASWAYPNQTIIVANASSEAFGPDTSGVFGLGTNINTGNFSDTVFGGFFSRNPTSSNFTFGMALNPPTVASNDGGALHWLAPDSSAYQGQISWTNVVKSNSSSASIMSDWVVQMNGWTFTSGSNSSAITSNGSAVVDPYYPDIYLPQSQAQTIYAGVGGAIMQSTSGNTEFWTIPCSAKMSFVVRMNSLSIPLDENDLIINDGNVCIGAIQGLTDPGVPQSILGGVFIAKLYLIFSVSPNGQNSIGFGSRAVGHPMSAGTISSIILGSLIVFAALAGGGFLFYRRSVNMSSRRAARYSPGGSGSLAPLMPLSRASDNTFSDYQNTHSFGTVADEEETTLRDTMYRPVTRSDYQSSGQRGSHSTNLDDGRSNRSSRQDGDVPHSIISVERNPDYGYTPSAPIDLIHSPPIRSPPSNSILQPYVTPPTRTGPMSAYEEKRRLRMQSSNRPSSHSSAAAVADDQSVYQAHAGFAEPPEYEP